MTNEEGSLVQADGEVGECAAILEYPCSFYRGLNCVPVSIAVVGEWQETKRGFFWIRSLHSQTFESRLDELRKSGATSVPSASKASRCKSR